MAQLGQTAVVVTSTGSVDYFGRFAYLPLFILRLKVHIDGREYTDGVDLSAEDFYRYISQNPQARTGTTPADFSAVAQLLLDLAEQGYKNVIVLTISKTLSQSYELVCETSVVLKNRLNIHVIDTDTCAAPEGYLAVRAANMALKGRSVPEILAMLEDFKNRCELLFFVNDLSTLARNGHLNHLSSIIGNFLQIKPLLSLKDGEIRVTKKVRTTANALAELRRLVLERVQEKNAGLMGMYLGNLSMYRSFIDSFAGQADVRWEFPLTPVVGAHLGADAVGIALFDETDFSLPENDLNRLMLRAMVR